MAPATHSVQQTEARPPIAVGQRIALEITDLAFGGEGVGRVGDYVVFVPFVCPGERVEAKVTEVKRHFARAVIARVSSASPDRVEPQCPYYGECGGCQYQHLAYEAQLRWKQKQISDLLQRVGGFPGARVEPVTPCPRPYGYRNRILVRSQWNRPALRLNLGYVRHDGGLVCDIAACALAEPGLNGALTQWRQNPPPKGGIKRQLRADPPGWIIPEHSFFQNNTFMLPSLIQTAQGRLKESGARHLIDVFCGVGFFALSLALDVDTFVGVELDRSAVVAARENQRRRGVQNGEFFDGDAEEWLPRYLAANSAAGTSVILDPPRTGCRPQTLAALRSAGPCQILYVSCHPATLARDLKALCESGRYRLDSITPLDLFPQTQHVECVADLRLGV